MPSIRTLPDRPVPVNPQFARFRPMWPAQDASAVARVRRRDPSVRVLIPKPRKQVGSGRSPVPSGVAGACPRGSRLGTVLERAAPAPPERARGPGGRAGGDPVHGPLGHGLLAAGVGHRLGGRAPAGLGELRGRGPRGLRVRHRGGAAGLRPAQGQADHPRPGPAPGRRPQPQDRLAVPQPRRAGRLRGRRSSRAPARSCTPTRSGPASTWSASTPAASSRSTPLRCFDTLDEAEADLRADPVPGDPGRRSGSGSAPTAPSPGPAPSAAARSSTTCRPPTWPATWTCCAGPSATPS